MLHSELFYLHYLSMMKIIILFFRWILVLLQSILSEESLSLQFLDVVTILLKYCSPKSSENGETQAVIVDLVATLGFFCANNKQNQVSDLDKFTYHVSKMNMVYGCDI